ncbi:Protein of unknown function [Fulvimarina manganoxydans]|uniref:VWFA domain-containing protein n=2 Tax=Fulvimarina manganoxydans TaxID=937218 RepID=A0A1W2CIB8_9HYPH|nr:Protein of unknown function [Fulvimarina manganoxydans]
MARSIGTPHRAMFIRVCAFLCAVCLGLIGLGSAGAQQRGLGDLGGAKGDGGLPVDVELVLAVDVSWSMNQMEQAIQRDGYAAAFRSSEVQAAILDGVHGRVAVTYLEWAGSLSQSVIVPWTLIDSKASAEEFAYRLTADAPIRARRTSIASAIDFSATLFAGNGFEGLKQVVDISGDGPNNEGRMVTEARDAAVRRGVTINGLPLMTTGQGGSWGSIANLDRYYETCVIGGPGAFMIPVNDWSQFPEAVRRKLVLELAGGWPSVDEILRAGAKVQPAQSGGAVDCLIGEKQWQERQRRWMRDTQ